MKTRILVLAAVLSFAPALPVLPAFAESVLKSQVLANPQFSVIQYNRTTRGYEVAALGEKRFRETAQVQGDTLENNYFKVVEGKSEEALRLDDFDGRNVIYHLMIARGFFHRLDPSNPALDRKITVRVRMDTAWNLATRFTDQEKHNNSAYYYRDYRGRWGAEMWFFTPESTTTSPGVHGLLFALEHLNFKFPEKGIEVGFNFKLGEDPFKKKKFVGMDLAKDPGVIYHEAFHWATDEPYAFDFRSDGNGPLKEDLANYFGSVINGRQSIADVPDFIDPVLTRRFLFVQPLDPVSKSKRIDLYNFTNYLPSVLWNTRLRVYWNQSFVDQAIWNSIRDHVSIKTRHSEFPAHVIQAARQLKNDSFDSAGQLQSTLEEYAKSNSFVELDKLFESYYESLPEN